MNRILFFVFLVSLGWDASAQLSLQAFVPMRMAPVSPIAAPTNMTMVSANIGVDASVIAKVCSKPPEGQQVLGCTAGIRSEGHAVCGLNVLRDREYEVPDRIFSTIGHEYVHCIDGQFHAGNHMVFWTPGQYEERGGTLLPPVDIRWERTMSDREVIGKCNSAKSCYEILPKSGGGSFCRIYAIHERGKIQTTTFGNGVKVVDDDYPFRNIGRAVSDCVYALRALRVAAIPQESPANN